MDEGYVSQCPSRLTTVVTIKTEVDEGSKGPSQPEIVAEFRLLNS